MKSTFIRIIALLSMAIATSISAKIVERELTLPNQLGSAVMYSPENKDAISTGVIVVHEWWGLNDYARNRAKMLAEAGHVAIAVDMYGDGQIATHPEDAMAFMQQAFANADKMTARFNAAKGFLISKGMVNPDKIYAIGYCFGGAVVLNQARLGNNLAGVASFHGSLGTQTPAKSGDIKARLLVATGGSDPMVPADQVSTFVQEMASAGVQFELLNYPDAKHSFTNPGSTEVGKKFNMPLEYNQQADEASWQALMDFIK